MSRFTKSEQADSAAAIKSALANATRDARGQPIVYTVLRSVSRSGMMRRISVYVIDRSTGEPVNLSWHYERSHGRMADDSAGRWAVKVSGCGMDMGFHLANNLANVAGLPSLAFDHRWL